MISTKNFLKFSCLALAGIFATGTAQAQELASFGVKLGLGFNSQSANTTSGSSVNNYSSSSMGFLFGPSADIGLGPVGVLVDVLWARRGVSYDTGSGTLNDTSVKLNNLYIPVQARFSVLPLLRLTAGGFWSLALGGGTQYDSQGNKIRSIVLADSQKMDFGLVGGLGVSVPLAVVSLTLEARYNFGLKNQAVDPVGDQSINNRSFDILAGVTF